MIYFCSNICSSDENSEKLMIPVWIHGRHESKIIHSGVESDRLAVDILTLVWFEYNLV